MSPRSGLLLFAVALALCACPARADGPAEGYKPWVQFPMEANHDNVNVAVNVVVGDSGRPHGAGNATRPRGRNLGELNDTHPDCQTVAQALFAYNLSTLAMTAIKTGLYTELTAPNQTLLVPLESAFYKLVASGLTTAFSASALKSKSSKYKKDLADYVRLSIIPGSYPTRSMHDAQRLDTLLDEVTVELKVPPAGEKLNVLVLGPYGGQSAFIVRKDVPVCGGGYIHITDAVILPHAI